MALILAGVLLITLQIRFQPAYAGLPKWLLKFSYKQNTLTYQERFSSHTALPIISGKCREKERERGRTRLKAMTERGTGTSRRVTFAGYALREKWRKERKQ